MYLSLRMEKIKTKSFIWASKFFSIFENKLYKLFQILIRFESLDVKFNTYSISTFQSNKLNQIEHKSSLYYIWLLHFDSEITWTNLEPFIRSHSMNLEFIFPWHLLFSYNLFLKHHASSYFGQHKPDKINS